MLRAIDHLVVAVTDLDGAVKTYGDLGFTVVPGGRHTEGATANALIGFRDTSYLELVGFTEPRPAHRWWAALARGGGLVDFGLQTDDVAGDAKILRQAGVHLGELERLGRHRPASRSARTRWNSWRRPARAPSATGSADAARRRTRRRWWVPSSAARSISPGRSAPGWRSRDRRSGTTGDAAGGARDAARARARAHERRRP